MKKVLIALMVGICLTSVAVLAACKDDRQSEAIVTETAYCYTPYNAGGNYGVFALAAGDEYQLEKEPSIDGLTLGGAFEGMEIYSAGYSEEENLTYVALSGALGEGDIGTIAGEGIVEGENISVDVMIEEATASTEDVIYDFTGGAVIEITLENACFKADIGTDDILLGGAAEGMQVVSVSTVTYDDGDGGEVLSEYASVTLSGDPNGMETAYLTLAPSATTFNREIVCVVQTDFCGGLIENAHIDTYLGYDMVYVSAHNVTFTEDVSGITLGGVLAGYATIESAEAVSPDLVAIELSFPYTYVALEGSVGYIEFPATTNEEGIDFFCTAFVAAPDIDYSYSQDGSRVTIDVTFEHGVLNDGLTAEDVVFSVMEGEPGVEVVWLTLSHSEDVDALSISLALPEDYDGGMVMFTIVNAYTAGKDFELHSISGLLYLSPTGD